MCIGVVSIVYVGCGVVIDGVKCGVGGCDVGVIVGVGVVVVVVICIVVSCCDIVFFDVVDVVCVVDVVVVRLR